MVARLRAFATLVWPQRASAHLITETWAPPPLSPNAIRPSMNVHRHYSPRGAYAQLHLCLSSIRISGPGHHVCAMAQMHRVAVYHCNPKRWFCPTEFMNTIDARYRVAKQPACQPHRPSSPPDRLSRLDSSFVIASLFTSLALPNNLVTS